MGGLGAERRGSERRETERRETERRAVRHRISFAAQYRSPRKNGLRDVSTSAGRVRSGIFTLKGAVGALTCSCEEEPGRAPESEGAGGEGKTSAVDSLSERGWGKLDHALTLLLREGPENPFFSYQAHPREDGTVAYGVLIRTTDPSALRSAGLPVGAVPNGIAPDSAVPDGEAARPNSRDAQVVTARLTTGEIREAAGMEEVLSIANPSEAKPH